MSRFVLFLFVFVSLIETVHATELDGTIQLSTGQSVYGLIEQPGTAPVTVSTKLDGLNSYVVLNNTWGINILQPQGELVCLTQCPTGEILHYELIKSSQVDDVKKEVIPPTLLQGTFAYTVHILLAYASLGTIQTGFRSGEKLTRYVTTTDQIRITRATSPAYATLTINSHYTENVQPSNEPPMENIGAAYR